MSVVIPSTIHVYLVANVQIIKKTTNISHLGLQLVTQKTAVPDLCTMMIIHITGQDVRRDSFRGLLFHKTGLGVWNPSQVSMNCKTFSVLYKY